MSIHIKYLLYVLRHKWFVFVYCRKLKVSLWQSVIHDWTKFLPQEWFPYARFFYSGEQSSKSSGGKIRKKSTPEFEHAWNHHQKHNKHHWQYWVLIPDIDGGGPLEIPDRYIKEMLADWMGASRAITKKEDAFGWYEKHKEKMLLNSETRKKVEDILKYVN